MTPFEKAGYTEVTNFRVLEDYYYFKKDEIVTLCKDDGTRCPFFKSGSGFRASMWIPDQKYSKLEVYEDEGK